jgi:uncharacterized membrane protein YuzA (DUF378 family)
MENMMKHCHCGPMKLAKFLVIVGAINWGLVGIGGFMGQNWNVVHMLLGMWPAVEWIVYILVGVAGIMKIFGCKCKTCMSCATCAVDAKGTDMSQKM